MFTRFFSTISRKTFIKWIWNDIGFWKESKGLFILIIIIFISILTTHFISFHFILFCFRVLVIAILAKNWWFLQRKRCASSSFFSFCWCLVRNWDLLLFSQNLISPNFNVTSKFNVQHVQTHRWETLWMQCLTIGTNFEIFLLNSNSNTNSI